LGTVVFKVCFIYSKLVSAAVSLSALDLDTDIDRRYPASTPTLNVQFCNTNRGLQKQKDIIIYTSNNISDSKER